MDLSCDLRRVMCILRRSHCNPATHRVSWPHVAASCRCFTQQERPQSHTGGRIRVLLSSHSGDITSWTPGLTAPRAPPIRGVSLFRGQWRIICLQEGAAYQRQVPPTQVRSDHLTPLRGAHTFEGHVVTKHLFVVVRSGDAEWAPPDCWRKHVEGGLWKVIACTLPP